MIVAAKAMTVRVELGIQQGVNSTLNSYLEKLLIMLTGSFGRKGTNQLHSWLVPLWGNSPNQRFGATDTEVIGGLLPPNLFPDTVLSDHPDRLRAVWIDSSNPVNTAANTAQVEKALARARSRRRGRCRHDRDGAAGALRAAGLLAIREDRVHAVQF